MAKGSRASALLARAWPLAPCVAVALSVFVARGLFGRTVTEPFFAAFVVCVSLPLLALAARDVRGGPPALAGQPVAAALGTLLGLAPLAGLSDGALRALAFAVAGYGALALLVEGAFVGWRDLAAAPGERHGVGGRDRAAAPGERHARTRRWVLAVAVVAGVVAPVPLLRAAAIAVAVLAFARSRPTIVLPREVGALAACAAVIAALLVPALALHEGNARVRDLLLLVAGTLVWAMAAARPIELGSGAAPRELGSRGSTGDTTRNVLPLWPAAAALAVLLVLVAGPLGAAVPREGDEDFHVHRVLAVRSFLGHVLEAPPLFAPLVFGLAAAVLARATRGVSRPGRAIAVTGALALGAAVATILVGATRAWGDLQTLLRYSPLEVWPQAVLSFAPTVASRPELFWAEGWFRLLPFTAVAVLACVVAARAPLGPTGRFLAAVALVTTPTVRYYASLLYLELPFVALMTFVLGSLAQERPADGLPRGPALLALVALPLMKETTLPFCALLAVHALACAWRGPRRRLVHVAAFFGPPALLAVALRDHAARPYSPGVGTLLDRDTYLVFARALGEQVGLLALLAPVGALAAWRRGRADVALVAIALVLGYACSMALDGRSCLFLSRFMLVLLPPLLVLAREALAWLGTTRAVAALVLLVASNLALTPVTLEGARAPFWGCYTVAEQDLVYPWEEAVAPLARTTPPATIEIVGEDYTRPLDHTTRKLAATWRLHVTPPPPALEAEAFARERHSARGALPSLDLLGRLVAEAIARAPSAVVVVVPPGELAWTPPAPAAYAVREARLGLCRLLVYTRRG